MLTAQLTALAVLAEEEHEVNEALSWGIGALSLGILLGMLLVLIAIGGGREHS
jgi:hypothetical protein